MLLRRRRCARCRSTSSSAEPTSGRRGGPAAQRPGGPARPPQADPYAGLDRALSDAAALPAPAAASFGAIGLPERLISALAARSIHEPFAIQSRALPDALAACLSFATLATGSGAPPLLLAGPPGAGKTLTVARLATRLVMAGMAPLVITADGQRAGGADQLSAFTRLLGLDLIEAGHPAALCRALAEHRGAVPVLIDLPGSNPFTAEERDELQQFADAAGGTIAVVMPGGTDPAEAADLAAAYHQAGADFLVATRLDLARRIGGVLAAAEAGLALAEAGVGPGAADGLLPMTPDWLARRLAQVPAPGCGA